MKNPPDIAIRYQRVSDAKRFYEILSNPHFVYFTACPANITAEKKWLAGNPQRRKQNLAYNYAIIYKNKVVGGVGIKINRHRPFSGELGYFIDEAYWGKGIATQATKLAEREGFQKLGLTRIEILMQPANIASEKVAIKCGYKKEGLLKKAVMGIDGAKKDAWLYAKTL